MLCANDVLPDPVAPDTNTWLTSGAVSFAINGAPSSANPSIVA
jgi:hypothetical protein